MTQSEIKERLSVKKTMLEHEIKGLLKLMGLSVPKSVFIGKGEGAALEALEALILETGIRYPLVAKVSFSGVASKTDVGGVRAGIRGAEELKGAVSSLMRIKGAEGVLIEETAPQGAAEVIVGGIKDPQFGPVVMFGIGGLFVELYRDVAFALTPVGRQEAGRLIRRIKGHRLLEGMRGRRPSDTEALISVIEAVSEIMETGLVEELDLNPVAVYPEGALLLDAKMELTP